MPPVKVSLYATLRSHVGGRASVEVDVEPGQTVEQLLRGLGVPVEKTRILFVNGRPATLAQTLQGGEQIGAFPAVGGG